VAIKSARPKHATASTFVFARLGGDRLGGDRLGGDWRLGLIEHPLLGRLMIPGGHVEPDEAPPETALREVTEETGLRSVEFIPAPGAVVPRCVADDAELGARLVARPWWIMEQPLDYDNHEPGPHFHIDHLYAAIAQEADPVAEPAHPFAWYDAAELAGLHMFDDTRCFAREVFGVLARLPLTD
jgi:8-oxo-dGTP pyrophosphatase MutT (NUDIX family)